jgi:hypothetical protein
MKIRILAGAALVLIAVQPAGAQSTTVSPGSLIADGYEVKNITDITAEEQKTMWPNDAVAPYIMITFQKGNSVAVCGVQMANWVGLVDATLANATLCKKH